MPHKKKDAHEKKVGKVMREFKEKELHTGSKKGPQVKKRKQAIAIALSEARKKVPGRMPAWLKRETKKKSSKTRKR